MATPMALVARASLAPAAVEAGMKRWRRERRARKILRAMAAASDLPYVSSLEPDAWALLGWQRSIDADGQDRLTMEFVKGR